MVKTIDKWLKATNSCWHYPDECFTGEIITYQEMKTLLEFQYMLGQKNNSVENLLYMYNSLFKEVVKADNMRDNIEIWITDRKTTGINNQFCFALKTRGEAKEEHLLVEFSLDALVNDYTSWSIYKMSYDYETFMVAFTSTEDAAEYIEKYFSNQQVPRPLKEFLADYNAGDTSEDLQFLQRVGYGIKRRSITVACAILKEYAGVLSKISNKKILEKVHVRFDSLADATGFEDDHCAVLSYINNRGKNCFYGIITLSKLYPGQLPKWEQFHYEFDGHFKCCGTYDTDDGLVKSIEHNHDIIP